MRRFKLLKGGIYANVMGITIRTSVKPRANEQYGSISFSFFLADFLEVFGEKIHLSEL